MSATEYSSEHGTRTWHADQAIPTTGELSAQYDSLLGRPSVGWIAHHRLLRRLGSGSQGVVFLSLRQGGDEFSLPVALKAYSPARYLDEEAYEEAMVSMGRVAAHVARIQQDNLLDVQDWVMQGRVRVMVMEWVDGSDIRSLLMPAMLDRLHGRVDDNRWSYLNKVVVTSGKSQPRIKAGVAVAVIRDCLAALAALHQAGVVHGDLKPANIMLKRTGNAKIVDVGSAFLLEEDPPYRSWTPAYAAPELHRGELASPRSDLASLGYVLVELLAGEPPFAGIDTRSKLIEAKESLPARLEKILPAEVVRSDLLLKFCQRLIAPDPGARFASAEEADLDPSGPASIQRQLVKGNLSSEYDNEIRHWLRDLGETGASSASSPE
jgi:serine/threonine-protein kinase